VGDFYGLEKDDSEIPPYSTLKKEKKIPTTEKKLG
jgi:hypothetical protein